MIVTKQQASLVIATIVIVVAFAGALGYFVKGHYKVIPVTNQTVRDADNAAASAETAAISARKTAVETRKTADSAEASSKTANQSAKDASNSSARLPQGTTPTK